MGPIQSETHTSVEDEEKRRLRSEKKYENEAIILKHYQSITKINIKNYSN
jgi:hypothetical protein